MSSESTRTRETDRKERTRRGQRESRAPGAWLRPRSRALDRTPAGRRSLEGRATVLALRLLARLPLGVAHRVGAALGRVLAWLPCSQRSVTRINLALCFPDASPADRSRLERASLSHLGRMMAELGALWTWDRERILALVRSVEGEEVIRTSLDRGRGAVIVSPHLGSWEMTTAYASIRHPGLGVYRPPRQGDLDRFVCAGRSRFGGRMLPAGARAVRELLRELEAGGLVGLMPDQDSGDGAGIFVPFFGELANTGVLVPRLVARTGARLILAFAERCARGEGFHLRFAPASEAAHSSDLVVAAGALNQDIERLVRRVPDQYLWSYRRFRIRPPGMEDPYKRG